MKNAALALAVLAATVPALAQTAPAYDKKSLAGLEWRSIGPFRGGRSVAVAGVPSQPQTFYFGATGGGVFKTTDGGINWRPITDGQVATGSVGAVEVALSDPNVIYVGMGESCIRGNVSHGDGVYKSVDGGQTWKHVGLKETEQIGRVRIHPQNPDLVYVAALGHTFGPNRERGVFRSKDGGAKWEKVLYVDDKTGAVDLAMDATNPRVLYASFWEASRKPWRMDSGGPGSSLWKTVDGGDNWTKITHEGLPKKSVWGRIGVAVSPANPNRVWALIEAEDGGVFRSEDAGKTWRRVNEARNLRQRAWYYTHIYADTKNPEMVYVLNTGLYRSNDGGRTYTPIQVPHGDNHDLWIDPSEPNRMINANDGGANVSYDGGRTWSRQDNQATAQFYHVITDDDFPYKVYGAQQDNSTVTIKSRGDGNNIDVRDWWPVGGCESGYIAPMDPNVSFAGCYGGVLERFDSRTGRERNVSVYPENPMGWGAEGMKYRFQWTFPIVISPHDKNVLYAGGNILFKSTNEGQSWAPISRDLTRNDPAKLLTSGGPITQDNTSVEYYGTIFAMAESPKQKDVLWVGSDDGMVHVSRDGGKSWEDVTPQEMRPGGPADWSMVSQVDPSPHDAATMYLAVNRYKHDDKKPYLFVTTDYGKSWRKIVNGIPNDAFTRVLRQDPVNRNLLYAGTETGMYVSFDNGARWQPLQLNLPVVPVTDLVVKNNDVVVATQGRSFWILDDVTPLRALSADVLAAEAHLFKPSAAIRMGGGGGFGEGGGGGAGNVGRNPPNGAVVYYHLKNDAREGEEVTLEFLDSAGKSIRKFTSRAPEGEAAPAQPGEFGGPPPAPRVPAKAGLNRFVWNLRHPDATRFRGIILWAGNLNGPFAVPGSYQVRLTAGGRTLTEAFDVRKDPRLATTQADFQKQFELLMKIRDKLTETHDAVTRIRETRDQVKAFGDRSRGNSAITEGVKWLSEKLTNIEEALYQTKNQSNQDPLNYPIRLNNKLASLSTVVAGAENAPTDQAYVVANDLIAKIDAELAKLKTVLATDVAAFNEIVRQQNVPAVVVR
jgi:photosystem II stability/assembly factor-like uncharacterized protein